MFALEHKTWEDGQRRLSTQEGCRPGRLGHDQYINRLNAGLSPGSRLESGLLFRFDRPRYIVSFLCSKMLAKLTKSSSSGVNLFGSRLGISDYDFLEL